ncbi:hypothetical protein TRICI_006183 [Trichomonascus ciferrii]|uniref:SCP domain-containing protein n=1 Tax=Trichomonascus ciferrii TaxID=44093 RepID=A0A642UM80_9ASCO|nr:hypothetical protein TRICI_006183 [Trichomonascus ciferrii]
MKLYSLATLAGIAQAVVVYQTAHYHVTVTAGDQDVASVSLPQSTSQPEQQQQQPQVQQNQKQDEGQQQDSGAKVVTVATTMQALKAQQSSSPTSEQAPSSTDQGEEASTTPNPSATGDTDIDEYAKKCIDRHNNDRSKHSAPKLAWNDTLADYAKKYLQNQNCVFAHSGGPYGENIAMGYDSAEDAIKAWYEENKKYNFQAGQFSESTGHFTQMVWKSSTQIGCADVDCGDKGTFMACEYFPRGNVMGQFVENVLSG